MSKTVWTPEDGWTDDGPEVELSLDTKGRLQSSNPYGHAPAEMVDEMVQVFADSGDTLRSYRIETRHEGSRWFPTAYTFIGDKGATVIDAETGLALRDSVLVKVNNS